MTNAGNMYIDIIIVYRELILIELRAYVVVCCRTSIHITVMKWGPMVYNPIMWPRPWFRAHMSVFGGHFALCNYNQLTFFFDLHFVIHINILQIT